MLASGLSFQVKREVGSQRSYQDLRKVYIYWRFGGYFLKASIILTNRAHSLCL